MHSCELITNLRAKKVLCHRIEVVRISGATTTDCVFCNVIGYRRITPGKALSNQLNEDRGIGRRSPDPFSLERGRGLGTNKLSTATASWNSVTDEGKYQACRAAKYIFFLPVIFLIYML